MNMTHIAGNLGRTPVILSVVLALSASQVCDGSAPWHEPPPAAGPRLVLADSCENLAAWASLHTHGDACSVSISPDRGRSGRGLRMDFSFVGFMGSVSAMRMTRVTLPEDFEISVDIRAEAPVNHLLIKVLDSLDNVWWNARWNYSYPRDWTTIRLKRRHLPYAWGPGGPQPLRRMDRIEFVVDVGNDAGRGSVWLDNFMIRDLGAPSRLPSKPAVTVTAHAPGAIPTVSADGRIVRAWTTPPGLPGGRLTLDLGAKGAIGGLALDWGAGRFARDFKVLLSDDSLSWRTAYEVRSAAGGRNWIYLPDEEARFVSLELVGGSDSAQTPAETGGDTSAGAQLDSLRVLDPEFSFSRNDMYRVIASESPRGSYPRYFGDEQSYWTVIGVPRDRSEALMNEQGMIETDKLGPSLEPFLFVNGELVTWADVTTIPSLHAEFMPMPSVRWEHRNGLRLTTSALASGPADSSVLLVRYRIENASDERTRGSLFVAVRPFQVNPPWQTFTIHGGVSRVDSISGGDWATADDRVTVGGRTVIPLTRPASFGCATFDQGDVTTYLRNGDVPPFRVAADPQGLASGAFRYEFDLQPGGTSDVVLAVPFLDSDRGGRPGTAGTEASIVFEQAREETVRMWEELLTRVHFTLPPSDLAVVNTLRSNLAFILVNADSVWTQPGSRSYERSWIRDGALTAAAMLQMGLTTEIREYIDWYAGFQYPDGSVPCIVEPRGADPTPEHDSHGQFIYMIGQYFRFTKDTAWLRTRWENVLRAARHIQSLRAGRKTDRYRSGTPVERACFGLVPESISHEGYSPKPMHSYWDNFFAVRGVKDAAFLAGVLGERETEREFSAELADYRESLSRSIVTAAGLKGLNVIPGCVELGDVGGMSTTVAVTPAEELGHLPEPLTRNSFDAYFAEWTAREKKPPRGGAYLPYEARFIGAYVYLGERERAVAFMDHLMEDRRPGAWNQWAEVVWFDPLAPKNIGDMPHTWVGSDFIRSVRSMFAYEREADTSLVIGAGLPGRWLAEPGGVGVEGLPTYYGPLTYSMRARGDRVIVEIAAGVSLPPGGIVVIPPDVVKAATVVRELPARIELPRR
jgi:hypothetical protein